MRKMSIVLSLILLLGFPLSQVKGQTLKLEEIVAKIQDNYDNFDDFSAYFTQVSTNKSINQKQETRGQVFLKKPGRMRWEYGPPDNQLIVSDGVNVWMSLPKLNQIYKEEAKQAFDAKTPLSFLSGKGKITEDFGVSLENSPKEGENYNLKLIPKEVHPALSKMFLEVDHETFWVKFIQIYDIYENNIELIFSEIKTNQNLSPDLFRFIIPQGAELITPSKR